MKLKRFNELNENVKNISPNMSKEALEIINYIETKIEELDLGNDKSSSIYLEISDWLDKEINMKEGW